MSARSHSRGYTVVELMMALAVFSAGVTGIITLQRTAVGANRMAKNVEIATSIAQAWQAQLAADASLWRPALSTTNTPWIATVNDNNLTGVWQVPAYNATRNFGARFDVLGQPTNVGTERFFCVHIRLSWLYRNQESLGSTGTPGNGTIRTDVRVFWLREGATRETGDCTNTAAASNVTVAVNSYYFVTQTGAVRQP